MQNFNASEMYRQQHDGEDSDGDDVLHGQMESALFATTTNTAMNDEEMAVTNNNTTTTFNSNNRGDNEGPNDDNYSYYTTSGNIVVDNQYSSASETYHQQSMVGSGSSATTETQHHSVQPAPRRVECIDDEDEVFSQVSLPSQPLAPIMDTTQTSPNAPSPTPVATVFSAPPSRSQTPDEGNDDDMIDSGAPIYNNNVHVAEPASVVHGDANNYYDEEDEDTNRGGHVFSLPTTQNMTNGTPSSSAITMPTFQPPPPLPTLLPPCAAQATIPLGALSGITNHNSPAHVTTPLLPYTAQYVPDGTNLKTVQGILQYHWKAQTAGRAAYVKQGKLIEKAILEETTTSDEGKKNNINRGNGLPREDLLVNHNALSVSAGGTVGTAKDDDAGVVDLGAASPTAQKDDDGWGSTAHVRAHLPSCATIERFTRLVNTENWGDVVNGPQDTVVSPNNNGVGNTTTPINTSRIQNVYPLQRPDVLIPRSLVIDDTFNPSCWCRHGGGSTDMAPKKAASLTLRRHQVDGIRFMWRCLVDAPPAFGGYSTFEGCHNHNGNTAEEDDNSINNQPASSSSSAQMSSYQSMMLAKNRAASHRNPYNIPSEYGCILAHNMGLGKSCQVTIFVNLFFKHVDPSARVVLLVPKSIIGSWQRELGSWGSSFIPNTSSCGGGNEDGSVRGCWGGGQDGNDGEGNGSQKKGFSPLVSPNTTGNNRVFAINDDIKKKSDKVELARSWAKYGGVLLLSYETLTTLQRDIIAAAAMEDQTSNVDTLLQSKSKKTSSSKAADLTRSPLLPSLTPSAPSASSSTSPTTPQSKSRIFSSLANNPLISNEYPVDLVICDEAHRLRNSDLGIGDSLKKLRATRRLLLTGTPLQNHLLEYWTMLSFTMPGFFEKNWFKAFFMIPIEQSMNRTATQKQVDIAKKRIFTLIKEVEPFVHRVDSSPLVAELPPLHEYVVIVPLSTLQQDIYFNLIEHLKQLKLAGNFNILQANAYASKVCAHPKLLYDFHASIAAKKSAASSRPMIPAPLRSVGTNNNTVFDLDEMDMDLFTEDGGGAEAPQASMRAETTRSNFFDVPLNYNATIADGTKIAAAVRIIYQAMSLGEKTLVFSMSTLLLDLLEKLLKEDLQNQALIAASLQHDAETAPSLLRGAKRARSNNGGDDNDASSSPSGSDDAEQYVPEIAPIGRQCKWLRIDGSTSGTARNSRIQAFQNTTYDEQTGEEDSYDVFLLSTKAGGVGLTLTAATRIIILDSSWNPSDDRQAIGRAFRYGQTKPVFAYRLISNETLEHRLLYQKVAKEWLFRTVVDTKHVKRDHLEGVELTGVLLATGRDAHSESKPRDPKVARVSAKCFSQDRGVLLHIANHVVSVAPHDCFFEDNIDEKYGAEELSWYERFHASGGHLGDAGEDEAEQQAHVLDKDSEAEVDKLTRAVKDGMRQSSNSLAATIDRLIKEKEIKEAKRRESATKHFLSTPLAQPSSTSVLKDFCGMGDNTARANAVPVGMSSSSSGAGGGGGRGRFATRAVGEILAGRYQRSAHGKLTPVGTEVVMLDEDSTTTPSNAANNAPPSSAAAARQSTTTPTSNRVDDDDSSVEIIEL